MAAPSLTYTLTNGTTADASQVMQNFNDLLNGITDGTKDLSLNALTCAGTATLNGHVNLGNSSADDLIVTASLASTLPIKTTNSYDIGTSTLGLRAAYFGANSQTVNLKGSSSMSATWTLTLPVTAGTDKYLLMTNGSGVSTWSQIVDASVSASAAIAGTKLAAATASAAGAVNNQDNSSFTATFTQTGGFSQAVTVTYRKVNNIVTLNIPSFAGTATAAAVIKAATTIPSGIRPTVNVATAAQVRNNSATQDTVGWMFALTNGDIQLERSAVTSTFTNSAGAGLLQAMSLTYNLD